MCERVGVCCERARGGCVDRHTSILFIFSMVVDKEEENVVGTIEQIIPGRCGVSVGLLSRHHVSSYRVNQPKAHVPQRAKAQKVLLSRFLFYTYTLWLVNCWLCNICTSYRAEHYPLLPNS